ncbi:O-antigen ligase family protein, partial [Patescibacteria group bacterium]|nr:O-antigen ligase family protein [Patescibacteria group bacterium]
FIFTVFLALFINGNSWKKLFNLLFIAGVLASLLAIVQYFNILKNIFISFEGGATPSFLGNSTFLAIYMLFLVFLSFTFLIQEKLKNKKILYAGFTLLFIFTILITNSRATYLGLLIGFFYFFFFYPRKFKTLKTIAASLVLLAIIVVIFFNLFPQVAEKNNLLKIAVNRLSIKKVATDLIGTRFSAWKITLKTIEEKPIFGWGPENSYIGFEKYYDPTNSEIKNMWWDRPHNVFLEIAATSGIVSIILYSLFWIFLLWQLQIFKRKSGDNENTYLAHGIQAMFIGYLVVLFFNFDNFSTYLISFFFIGYSFYLISEHSEKKIIYPTKTNILKNKFIYIPLLFLLICFIWFWNIKPLYLNEKISYVKNLVDAKKCQKALNIVDNIWQGRGILESYAGLRYTDFIKRCASSKPEKEVDYSKKASEVLKISSKIQPKFTRTWIFLGSFTNVLAAKEENIENRNKLLLEARSYLEKALELSPKRQEIFIEIEKSYIVAGDYQAMKKIAYDCIDIDSSYGQCYWYLGIAEIFLGDQENGKKHIQESLEKGGSPSYIQLGVAYISQKNYKDAADAYHMLTVLYPENANYHAVMAFLSREIGDYARAGSEALKVFELQPENKEVLKFLEQLLGLNPNDPTLHFSLAYIYTQIGETEKARQEYLIVKSLYLQAVTKYPKDAGYHLNLAGVCKELGEYERAYKEALLAEKLDSKNFHNKAMDLIGSLPGDYWDRYTGKK